MISATCPGIWLILALWTAFSALCMCHSLGLVKLPVRSFVAGVVFLTPSIIG